MYRSWYLGSQHNAAHSLLRVAAFWHISAAGVRAAAVQLHVVATIDRRDRQTDGGGTDTEPLRTRSLLEVGSVSNKRKQLRLRKPLSGTKINQANGTKVYT